MTRIIDTYIFYDEPVLYSWQDETGQLFLAVAITDGFDHLPISEETLALLTSETTAEETLALLTSEAYFA